MSHLIRANQISHKKSGKNKESELEYDDDVLSEKISKEKNFNSFIESAYRTPKDDHGVDKESVADSSLGEESIKEKFFDEGKRAGYSKGFIDGKEEGIVEGVASAKKEMQQKIEKVKLELETTQAAKKKVQDLLRSLEEGLSNEVISFEKQSVQLVYEVVLKIIGAEAVDKNLIEKTLKKSFAKCIDNKILKIRLSLEDYQLIKGDKLTNNITTLLENVELIPDVKILPGGCIIETDAGSLDSRLDEQLVKFKGFLLNIYQSKNISKDA